MNGLEEILLRMRSRNGGGINIEHAPIKCLDDVSTFYRTDG
ncbi:hypothetical protein METHB2_300009 [Candidatus Methylobacter favarea]|uniref:Uncharacterized protein n=1 Tax=Candidatus Methylobacter favarea TaxID=2707345 RepID=A0A8S0YA04_9GAMM|nr:hypothetical protein METHB2_300009 [Candidatus Methylobacter favarea]